MLSVILHRDLEATCSNSPFAWPGYLVQNHTCWDATCAMRLPKQRKVKIDWCELLCFGSSTLCKLHLGMCDFVSCDWILQRAYSLCSKSFFVLEVPLLKLHLSMCDFVSCDWILQRAYSLYSKSCFVLEVPLCKLHPSMSDFVLCDRVNCKGPIPSAPFVVKISPPQYQLHLA